MKLQHFGYKGSLPDKLYVIVRDVESTNFKDSDCMLSDTESAFQISAIPIQLQNHNAKIEAKMPLFQL